MAMTKVSNSADLVFIHEMLPMHLKEHFKCNSISELERCEYFVAF